MQVSVIVTPSFSNAAIARRSRSSIAAVCPSILALEKSVPRGSVIVGTRTLSFRPSAASPEALGVGHDVRLRHRHEVRRAEEFADLDLVLQGLLMDCALFAGEDVLLLAGEPHGHTSRRVAYMGGAVPRPTFTRGVTSVPSDCFCAAAMKIAAPGFSSLLSPGR